MASQTFISFASGPRSLTWSVGRRGYPTAPCDFCGVRSTGGLLGVSFTEETIVCRQCAAGVYTRAERADIRWGLAAPKSSDWGSAPVVPPSTTLPSPLPPAPTPLMVGEIALPLPCRPPVSPAAAQPAPPPPSSEKWVPAPSPSPKGPVPAPNPPPIAGGYSAAVSGEPWAAFYSAPPQGRSRYRPVRVVATGWDPRVDPDLQLPPLSLWEPRYRAPRLARVPRGPRPSRMGVASRRRQPFLRREGLTLAALAGWAPVLRAVRARLPSRRSGAKRFAALSRALALGAARRVLVSRDGTNFLLLGAGSCAKNFFLGAGPRFKEWASSLPEGTLDLAELEWPTSLPNIQAWFKPGSWASPGHIARIAFPGAELLPLAQILRRECVVASALGGFEPPMYALTLAEGLEGSGGPVADPNATAAATPKIPGLNNALMVPAQLVTNAVSPNVQARAAITSFPRDVLSRPTELTQPRAGATWPLAAAYSEYRLHPGKDSRTLPVSNRQLHSLLSPTVSVAHNKHRLCTLYDGRAVIDDREYIADLGDDVRVSLHNILHGVADARDVRNATPALKISRNVHPTQLTALRNDPRRDYIQQQFELQRAQLFRLGMQGTRYLRAFTQGWRYLYLAALAEELTLAQTVGGHAPMVWQNVGNRPLVDVYAINNATEVINEAGAILGPDDPLPPNARYVNLEECIYSRAFDIERGQVALVDCEGLDPMIPEQMEILCTLLNFFIRSSQRQPTWQVAGGANQRPLIAQFEIDGPTAVICHFGAQAIPRGGGAGGSLSRRAPTPPVVPQWDPNFRAWNIGAIIGNTALGGAGNQLFQPDTRDVYGAIRYLVSTTGAHRDCLDAHDLVAYRVYGTSVNAVDVGGATQQARALNYKSGVTGEANVPTLTGFADGERWFLPHDRTLGAYFTPFYALRNLGPEIEECLARPPRELIWYAYHLCSALAASFTWAAFGSGMRWMAFYTPADPADRPLARFGRRESDFCSSMLHRHGRLSTDPFSLYHRNAMAFMYGFAPCREAWVSIDPQRAWRPASEGQADVANPSFGIGAYLSEWAFGGWHSAYLEAWMLVTIPDFMVLPFVGGVPKWPAGINRGHRHQNETPSMVRLGATLPPFNGLWWQQDGGQFYSMQYFASIDPRNPGMTAGVGIDPATGVIVDPVADIPQVHLRQWVVPDQDALPAAGELLIPGGGENTPYAYRMTQYGAVDFQRPAGTAAESHWLAPFFTPGAFRQFHFDCQLANGNSQLRPVAFGVELGANPDPGLQQAWRELIRGTPDVTLRLEYLGPYPDQRRALEGFADLITVVSADAWARGEGGVQLYHATASHEDDGAVTYTVLGPSRVAASGNPAGGIGGPAAMANHSDIHYPQDAGRYFGFRPTSAPHAGRTRAISAAPRTPATTGIGRVPPSAPLPLPKAPPRAAPLASSSKPALPPAPPAPIAPSAPAPAPSTPVWANIRGIEGPKFSSAARTVFREDSKLAERKEDVSRGYTALRMLRETLNELGKDGKITAERATAAWKDAVNDWRDEYSNLVSTVKNELSARSGVLANTAQASSEVTVRKTGGNANSINELAKSLKSSVQVETKPTGPGERTSTTTFLDKGKGRAITAETLPVRPAPQAGGSANTHGVTEAQARAVLKGQLTVDQLMNEFGVKEIKANDAAAFTTRNALTDLTPSTHNPDARGLNKPTSGVIDGSFGTSGADVLAGLDHDPRPADIEEKKEESSDSEAEN